MFNTTSHNDIYNTKYHISLQNNKTFHNSKMRYYKNWTEQNKTKWKNMKKQNKTQQYTEKDNKEQRQKNTTQHKIT